MKISLAWVKDYVSLPAGLSIEKLRTALTMSTVEVEAVEDFSQKFDNMVTGKVLDIQKHPNANKLSLVKLDLGPRGSETLVCGGSNLRTGMMVAVALPGAQVMWHGQGGYITLEAAKIRGVESRGMVVASSEIGLSELFPAADDHEIIDLTGVCDAAPGTALAQALGLDDVILTIDNKSLTNRPDLWGHYGIARELSAIFNVPMKPLPSVELPGPDDSRIRVSIEDTAGCRRYMGVLLEGLKDQQAPFAMRKRLSLVGQRPISLLVDLTNYVMFAVGQPTHVFDYELVGGKAIVVRRARAGESLQLLDGKSYKLQESDLVIADESKPLALAGVMGGEPSSVTKHTSKVLLEAASFEPIGIRHTASRHGLRSDASMRFEKGVDSPRAREAASLFLTLLREIEPSVRIAAAADCFPVKPVPVTVSVTHNFIVSRIGKEISAAEIREKLTSLGFAVQESQGSFLVSVPSWRATGDVDIPEDIVEEVARLLGYDNLGFVPPKVVLTHAVLQPQLDVHRAVKEYLALSAGMNEVVTYPWVEEQLLNIAGFKTEDCLQMFAPPAESTRCLQPSLIPAMLFAIERNVRFFDAFSVFEMARVFIPGEKYGGSGKGEQLPGQPKRVAGAVAGAKDRDVYLEAKGILEGLCKCLRFPRIEFRIEKRGLPWASRGTTVSICCGEERLGYLGLLSPAAAHKAGVGKVQSAIFELELSVLERLPRPPVAYQKLPQFPVVEFDLAMIFEVKTKWAEIEAALAGIDPLISQVIFFDEYKGGQISAGKKSIAFKLVLMDRESTLTSERASATATKAVERLKAAFGAELRGTIQAV